MTDNQKILFKMIMALNSENKEDANKHFSMYVNNKTAELINTK